MYNKKGQLKSKNYHITLVKLTDNDNYYKNGPNKNNYKAMNKKWGYKCCNKKRSKYEAKLDCNSRNKSLGLRKKAITIPLDLKKIHPNKPSTSWNEICTIFINKSDALLPSLRTSILRASKKTTCFLRFPTELMLEHSLCQNNKILPYLSLRYGGLDVSKLRAITFAFNSQSFCYSRPAVGVIHIKAHVWTLH